MSISRTPTDRRSFATGILASAAVGAFASRGFAVGSGSAGAVVTLKGTADATANGGSRRLAPSSQVFVADVVQTGADSRISLQLGNRTRLNLGATSQIKIDKYLVDAGGTIELIDGTIMYEHDGPPAGAELEVRSSYGLIAVRGTRFYAGPSNGMFGVLVSTGRVVVTSGGKSVTVHPQQGTDIAAPGAPPSAPKAWGPPRIRAMQAAVR